MNQPEAFPTFLEQMKQMYSVSGIPLAILDRNLFPLWYNESLLCAFPMLKHPGGIEELLSGYSSDMIREQVSYSGHFRCEAMPDNLFNPRGFVIFSTPSREDPYYFLQPLCENLQGTKAAPQGIAHTLSSFESNYRNPLTDIFSSLSILKGLTKTVDNEFAFQQLEYLQQIGNSSLSLLRFGQMVTEYTKLSSGLYHIRETYLDLPGFLRELFTSVSEIIRPMEIPFFWQVSEAPFYAVCDTTCLTSIIGQLISNACRFTRPGNRIEASVTFTEETEQDFIGPLENFKTLRLRLIDRGIGIPPELSHRVFEPYFSRGPDGQPFVGNGLGLSIARHAAALMGGTITFTSLEGGGCIFQVTIPLRRRSLDTPELHSWEMPAPVDRFSSLRVILGDMVSYEL